MPTCFHCRRESPAAHYDRTVHNIHHLHGEWSGWRMAGKFLIAPGPTGRITPEQLSSLLWEQQKRVSVNRSRSVSVGYRPPLTT